MGEQQFQKVMAMDYAKNILHDDAAERAVLGAILQNNSLYLSSEGVITEASFHNLKHQLLFRAIASIINDNKVADIVTVCAYLNAHPNSLNPQAYELAEISSSSYGIEALFHQHLARINELAARRDVWRMACKLLPVGTDESADLDEAMKEIQNFHLTCEPQRTTTIKDTVGDLIQLVRKNQQGQYSAGLQTGFRLIDTKGGLHLGDLVIIAADTSQGKTSLALTITLNTALCGTPSIIYSMEMQKVQLTARLIAMRSGINASAIMYARLSEEQRAKFDAVVGTVSDLPFIFDDNSTSSIERIISSIRLHVRRNGIRLAVIDYLQILGTTQKVNNTEQFYGDVTRRLKNLAKELNVCIIALSQLARDRENPEPTLARLRASGQIAEAADTVMLIYRPEVYGKRYRDKTISTAGTAQITIAKGRNIGTGSDYVGFVPDSCLFYDLEGVIPTEQPIQPQFNDDEPF